MLSHFQRLLLSVTSGILLSFPWIQGFSGLFIFIGLVPLLILEDFYSRETIKTQGLFWYSLLCFGIWNILTTWWIIYPTSMGAISLITLNSLLFSLVYWLYHISKKRFGKAGNFVLIIYWTAFEYIYLNTEISWPWLNFGNGLANSVKLVQWYEYTGVLGGTIWILLVNVLLAAVLIRYLNNKPYKVLGGIAAATFIVPAIFSLVTYYNFREEHRPLKMVIVQPNIDPFTEKFDGLTASQQLDILLNESSKPKSTDADYIIGPETAIGGYNLENRMDTNWAVKSIRHLLRGYPNTSFIVGAETALQYAPGTSRPVTATKLKDEDVWHDRFNSALQIDSGQIQVYHKSKLVIGVEKTPFIKQFRYLKKLQFNVGGSQAGLGWQNEREVFSRDTVKVAPVICYESVYGDYVTDYVKLGANVLVVITNDGWFRNTSGHWQHLNCSRLRAIETRRSVARSANTGISAFINQRGDIVQSLGWGERGVLVDTINTNNRQTFYAKHGDYLGMIAVLVSLLGMILDTKGARNRKVVGLPLNPQLGT